MPSDALAIMSELERCLARGSGYDADRLAGQVATLGSVPFLQQIRAYRHLLTLYCLAGQWLDALVVIRRLQRICARHGIPDPTPDVLVRICLGQARQLMRAAVPRERGARVATLRPSEELAEQIIRLQRGRMGVRAAALAMA